MNRLGLKDFDGHLMDGFTFCRKVYAYFNQTQRESDGIGRLRLRSDKGAKKVLEELLPLTHYIRSIYKEGRSIRVRWVDGGQSYDVVLLSSGFLVEKGMAKKRQHVEVTPQFTKRIICDAAFSTSRAARLAFAESL